VKTQFGTHVVETWRQILTRSAPPSREEKSSPDIFVRGALRRGPVSGPFSSSEFLLELRIQDVVHLGSPKVRRVDQWNRTERWGDPLDWCWPNPNQRRVAWVDDERHGLTQRTLARAEDALGAEGSLGDLHLRFERILELGRNQVVYALYGPEKNRWLAYGFDRTLFEPTYQRPR
jgi:hypothetical protein